MGKRDKSRYHVTRPHFGARSPARLAKPPARSGFALLALAAGLPLSRRLAWGREGNRTVTHGSGPSRFLEHRSIEAECVN